jgi:hypothetical protein
MPTPPATLIVGLLRLPGPTARARRGCRSQRQDRHPTLCQPFGRPLHCRLLLQRSRRTCGQARNNLRHWRRLRVPPGPSSKRPPSSAQSTDDQPGTADPTHPKPGPSQAVSGMSRTSRANAVAAEANGPISLCAVTTCPYPSGVLLPGDIDNWHRCGAAVGALPQVNHFKHRRACPEPFALPFSDDQ